MNKQKEEIKEEIPLIMTGDKTAVAMIEEYRNDIVRNKSQTDQTKYAVMEGMQQESKIPFFTEFIDDNDILRMNTIEMFVNIAPMIVRKTSDVNRKRIDTLLQNVYSNHVKTHKRNMVSKQRKREDSYTKILSQDPTNEVMPSGFRKFFGIGGNNGKA